MYNRYDTCNSVLTNLAQGLWLYPSKETDLTRHIFPVVSVETETGLFDKYDIAPGLTPVDTTLSRDNSPRRIQLRKTEGNWRCLPQSLEIATFGPSLLQKGRASQIREGKVRTLLSAMFASRQKATADALTAAVSATEGLGNWAADTDVVGEIDTLCRQVAYGSGKKANKLLIGMDAWSALRNHPSVISRLPGLAYGLTPEALKDVLSYKGLEIILVDSAVIISGSITPLLSNGVVALFNEETPSLEDMSFGKEFSLTPNGPEVLSYKEHGGVNEVDMLMWSSDCQVVNPASCARLELATGEADTATTSEASPTE